MMIAELIDGDDFRDRLMALGIPLAEDASPESCARLAWLQHQQGGVPGLPALVQELSETSDVMLPAVRQALAEHLLPLLD